MKLQQQDMAEIPILIDEVWFFGGRVNIDAANALSMSKIIDLIHGKDGKKPITANGHKFLAVHVSAVPKTATLSFRIESEGTVEELISGPRRGLARLNGWRDLGPTPFRILKIDGNNSCAASRFIRVAVTEPAVNEIKKLEGVVYCGERRASVHYNNKQLTSQTVVEFSHK